MRAGTGVVVRTGAVAATCAQHGFGTGLLGAHSGRKQGVVHVPRRGRRLPGNLRILPGFGPLTRLPPVQGYFRSVKSRRSGIEAVPSGCPHPSQPSQHVTGVTPGGGPVRLLRWIRLPGWIRATPVTRIHRNGRIHHDNVTQAADVAVAAPIPVQRRGDRGRVHRAAPPDRRSRHGAERSGRRRP